MVVNDGAFSDSDGDDVWFYKVLVELLMSEYDPVLVVATNVYHFILQVGEFGDTKREISIFTDKIKSG